MNRFAVTDVEHADLFVIDALTEGGAAVPDADFNVKGRDFQQYFGTIEFDHASTRFEVERIGIHCG